MSALSPHDFLEALVGIPSLSGHEAEASAFVVEQMHALGYREAHVDTAGSAVGYWGTPNGSPRLILLGHIDTVPGAIPVRVEDGVLHGRGAVDAKGPLATFIHAVASLPRETTAEVIVIGATEEEAATSKGARQALIDHEPPDFCIIGEPSGTRGVTLGYKGRLLIDLHLSRPMTHTAHAHQSVAEAAFTLHRAIAKTVAELDADLDSPEAALRALVEGQARVFDRIDYALRDIHTSADGLTDTAEALLAFRIGARHTATDVEAAVRAIVERVDLGPEFSVRLAPRGHEEPVRRDRRNPLVAAFFSSIRAEGLEPRTVVKTGTSDMNVVDVAWPGPMVAFGPGDSALDHTPHERLDLAEYDAAIRILERVLGRLTA